MTPAPPSDNGAGVCDDALAAALFAVDPAGLGGVSLRSGPGPERDAWMARLRTLLPPTTPIGRAPLGIADDRLLGGLDLAASLSAGRPVMERGVLAAHDGGVVILPMAERLDDGCAARLCAVLDCGEVVVEREGMTARQPARLGLVLLDEGYETEERPPERLSERLAFLDIAPGAPDRSSSASFGPPAVGEARRMLALAEAPPGDLVEAICAAAAALGLHSIRHPLLAVRAARVHAALRGRTSMTEEDAAVAVRLVLAPRALTLPSLEADAPEQEAEAPADAPSDGPRPDEPDRAPEPEDGAAAAERVLEAARAVLPDGFLDHVVADNRRAARAPRRGGGGAAVKAARRGRPIASRAGKLRDGDRLDLPGTLRAAAPWARLRAAAEGRVAVRAEDFRIRRFVQRRESTTIFVVDASGSAAFQRLAEAKGVVELLLAKAYVSRARVALIAFRRSEAELRLAPTRSLTRARNSLADLPGGGGTPLALGLDAGLALALAERARERTPILVVLSDGRANVASDGTGGRDGAERDALAAAKRIGEAGIDGAYMDTSPRPQPGGDRFARAMGAAYALLPYADPGRVSAVVDDLRGRR